MRRHDIFLHFLNRDSRQIYGLFRGLEQPRHRELLARSLNAAAILCESRCIAPPGFILECDIAQNVLEQKNAFLRERLFEFPMRDASLSDLAERKRAEYAPTQELYKGLYDDQRIAFLAEHANGLIPRKVIVGQSIVDAWQSGPDDNRRLWNPVTRLVPTSSLQLVLKIPELLVGDGTAATWQAISQHLPTEAAPADRELRRILQHDYFSLYVKEFGLVVLSNLPLMQDSFGIRMRSQAYDYEWLRTALDVLAVESLLDASAETIVSVKKQRGTIRFLDAYAGLCAHCSTATDLRYHLTTLAADARFRSGRFKHSWVVNVLNECVLPDASVAELGDALDEVADRIERRFGLLRRTEAVGQKLGAIIGASSEKVMDRKSGSEIVFFVALEEEFEILKTRWSLTRGFVEFAAIGEVNHVKVDVLCARTMGRVPAAVTTGYYLAGRHQGPPKLIIVVGLAGGFPEENIEEGMILIPHTVVDLANRKITESDGASRTQFRRRDFNLDKRLYDYLTSSDFKQKEWEQAAIAQSDWPKHRRPSVHEGLIACVDEVVSSNEWRQKLLANTPKLLGVEMEGGGVCAAAAMYHVPVAMIRAVSDKADPSKVDTAWRTRGMKTIAALVEAVDWGVLMRGARSR